jgi:hypothetical protein
LMVLRSCQSRMVMHAQIALEPNQSTLRQDQANTPSSGLSRMGCTMPQQLGTPQHGMFGHASSHSFAPHPERRWLHVKAHEGDHRRLVQAELHRHRLERRAVFPSHLDDA